MLSLSSPVLRPNADSCSFELCRRSILKDLRMLPHPRLELRDDSRTRRDHESQIDFQNRIRQTPGSLPLPSKALPVSDPRQSESQGEEVIAIRYCEFWRSRPCNIAPQGFRIVCISGLFNVRFQKNQAFLEEDVDAKRVLFDGKGFIRRQHKRHGIPQTFQCSLHGSRCRPLVLMHGNKVVKAQIRDLPNVRPPLCEGMRAK